MFKFNFKLDDDEEDLEKKFESITLEDDKKIEEPIIPTQEYLIKDFPIQVVELEGIRPVHNEVELNDINLVYKRYLSDIKLHLAQQDELKKENNVQDEIRTWIDGLDVVRHVYEGGFKTWESALDLAAYLLKLDASNFKNKNVIELGCGSSIPSLTLLRNFEPEKIHFSDYNQEVLSWITLPNLLSNLYLPENKNENDEEVEVDLEQQFINKIHEQDKFKAFYGDWEGLPKLTKEYVPMGYDIILSTETIYAPELIPKLYNTINQLLRKPDGVAYIAAKVMYFGVGGGTLQFQQQVEKGGQMVCETVFQMNKGIAREILKISWK